MREDLRALTIVAVIVTLAMLPHLLFFGADKLPGDLGNQYLPFKLVALDALRAGELPYWNPYLFSGAPLLADPQNSLLYPSLLLFLLLPTHLAFAVNQYLHMLVLAFGTYALLRLYCERLPALAGACVFALSGPVFFKLSIGIDPLIQLLAWLPWIFFCLEQHRCRSKRHWAVLAGLCVALALLAGFPTHAFFILLSVAIYLVFQIVVNPDRRTWRERLISTLWCSISLALAPIMAAAQLLPSAEFIALSGRSTPSYTFVGAGSLPLTGLVTALLPDLFGSATTNTAIFGASWGEQSMYVGALPVILALLALVRARAQWRRAAAVYPVLAVVFLVLALGANNPSYWLLYSYVPGFQQLADPGRMTIMYAFFLALTAAMSLQRLAAVLPEAGARARRWLVTSSAAAGALLLGALAVLILGSHRLAAIAAPLIHRRYGELADEKLQKLDVLFATQAASIAVLLIVLVTGVTLIVLRMTSRISARAFLTGCLLVMILDSGVFALRLTTTMRVSATTTDTPSYISALRSSGATHRVLPLNAMSFINQGSRYRIPAITGYNPLILASTLQLLGTVRGEPFDSSERVPVIDHARSPWLAMMDVGYVVSETPLTDAGLTLLHHGDAYLYATNLGESRRATMVFDVRWVSTAEQARSVLEAGALDPMKTAVLVGPEPPVAGPAAPPLWEIEVARAEHNRVALVVDSDAQGWLVLSDTYYPGWRAYVDGSEVPLYQANLAMRAVELPAGRSRVEFVYEPTGLRVGLVLSGVGVFSMLTLMLLATRRQWNARSRFANLQEHTQL